MYTSFPLLIGQFAVDAAETEYSWAGAVGSSELTLTFETARLTLIRNKNRFSVTEMLLHLVFGLNCELEDDSTTVENCGRVMYVWRIFRSQELLFLDVC